MLFRRRRLILTGQRALTTTPRPRATPTCEIPSQLGNSQVVASVVQGPRPGHYLVRLLNASKVVAFCLQVRALEMGGDNDIAPAHQSPLGNAMRTMPSVRRLFSPGYKAKTSLLLADLQRSNDGHLRDQGESPPGTGPKGSKGSPFDPGMASHQTEQALEGLDSFKAINWLTRAINQGLIHPPSE